jgi:nitrogen fixation protein NifU and related proteins
MQDLYRQVIMDHYKYPRNKGLISDSKALLIHLNNPSCGDEITIQLVTENQQIKTVVHEGSGCSICCASASVMSVALEKHTIQEGLQIIQQFYELIKGLPYNTDILFKDAVAFSGVSQFPARIKCATLSWKAAEKGLLALKEVSHG